MVIFCPTILSLLRPFRIMNMHFVLSSSIWSPIFLVSFTNRMKVSFMCLLHHIIRKNSRFGLSWCNIEVGASIFAFFFMRSRAILWGKRTPLLNTTVPCIFIRLTSFLNILFVFIIRTTSSYEKHWSSISAAWTSMSAKLLYGFSFSSWRKFYLQVAGVSLFVLSFLSSFLLLSGIQPSHVILPGNLAFSCYFFVSLQFLYLFVSGIPFH